MTSHVCELCDKTFTKRFSLKRHYDNVHNGYSPNDGNPNCSQTVQCAICSSDLGKTANLKCELCDKTFTKRFSLKRHYDNVHNGYIPNDGNPNCSQTVQCAICSSDLGKTANLNEHLLSKHQINVESEKITFTSEDEFLKWKKCHEESEKSLFINRRGSYRSKYKKVTYYQCHRSGNYRTHLSSECQRKRSMKIQGTKKINSYCPAKMKATTSMINGSVEVEFCKTHVGHQALLAHLSIPDDERQTIATKIAQKIPFDAIIDEVQKTVTKEVTRRHLLTKQDLRNIVREYSLDSECVRHTNDAISVEKWVEMEIASDKNSVIMYKPQGLDSSDYPELTKDDFMLGIMTEAQAGMLKKYGRDCICIDSTHGTNAYKFEMTTILVLDDMRQGFPCAFLFSNRNDHIALDLFLNSVKSKVGEIKAKVLMTDMADVFYNSWKSTMGDVDMRLFCSWHVQRAWQRRLNTDIKDLDLRKETLKKMYTLQNEVDVKNFEKIMPVIISECTCIDACVKWNMCKHIHLVCSTLDHNIPPVPLHPELNGPHLSPENNDKEAI
ncbi:uncharacterized protein LOC128985204 [Macrosteles quadrilineatus]|uniref:uncharacterized protein LOC128982506 n=1 Tax=Macrosteles quadrilineatus TaxID=74068 RepID=UPI0023E29326|nr:uncharacterized protein LOC128982506 [Macrosteles quadrilineatus]XP_054260565.1 uncharacterized protein LOC128985204 [Macrosteles quadrilineatus]